jgi:hypothetical protein
MLENMPQCLNLHNQKGKEGRTKKIEREKERKKERKKEIAYPHIS